MAKPNQYIYTTSKMRLLVLPTYLRYFQSQLCNIIMKLHREQEQVVYFVVPWRQYSDLLRKHINIHKNNKLNQFQFRKGVGVSSKRSISILKNCNTISNLLVRVKFKSDLLNLYIKETI
jgi:hypothetical protein